MKLKNSFSGLLFLGLLLLIPAHTVAAATFTVTKTGDDDGLCEVDDCAFREAIIAANATPGMDIVILPGGIYQLSIQGTSEGYAMTGDLDVRDDITIIGDVEKPTIIVGDGTDRIFTIWTPEASLSQITMTGGYANDISGNGGAITVAYSNLSMENCLILDNQATGSGGGINIVEGSSVSLINTLVVGNEAGLHGGGIRRNGGSTEPANLTLINSTVSGNSAYLNGGGISGLDPGQILIINSTVANNTALQGSAYSNSFGGVTTWTNSLVVGDCRRTGTSNGGNVESPGDTCGFGQPTDLPNVADPGLGPLAYNGGPTRTHALLPGSPAIDAGVDADCEATDQRGVARPYDGDGDGIATCDAGAVEFTGVNLDIPTLGGYGLTALVVLLGTAAWRMLGRSKRRRSRVPTENGRT